MRTSKDEAALRSAIRKAFSRSSIVIEMMQENSRKVPRFKKNGERHKIDGSEHLCELCREWVRGPCNIDHKIPVVDPEVGYVDIHTFISRLYCDRDNLQKICKSCHDAKTAEEWKHRRLVKARGALEEALQLDDEKKRKKYLKSWTEKRLPSIKHDAKFMAMLNEARITHGLKPLIHEEKTDESVCQRTVLQPG